MLVNEGLPLYLVSRLRIEVPASRHDGGNFGMAFKGNSDDVRSSLSYKLKRILRFKAGQVLCHDPYVKNDSDLSDLDAVGTLSWIDSYTGSSPRRLSWDRE